MSEFLPQHAAHCKNCRAGFYLPSHAGAPFCPNCFGARLEPIPAFAQDAAPELVIPFTVNETILAANLERWARDIPFQHSSLNWNALRARVTRVYLPMYLADARVWGTWRAQVGFDYLVASSEERYQNAQWVTQRINETRIRWEPRAGDISRAYENIAAPALEQHTRELSALATNGSAFDTSRAISFSPDALANSLLRAPELANDAAWKFAQVEVERRAARDCQNAANAQHIEQFELRAAYGEPRWTLMLLPTFVTSYNDDDGKWIPVRVNGQTGAVSGAKRASMNSARRWTYLIGGIAFLAFLFALLVGLLTQVADAFTWLAALALVVTLLLALAAPLPLIIAWQYNWRQAEK